MKLTMISDFIIQGDPEAKTPVVDNEKDMDTVQGPETEEITPVASEAHSTTDNFFGIDMESEEYTRLMDEVDLLKTHDPKLYQKIMNWD